MFDGSVFDILKGSGGEFGVLKSNGGCIIRFCRLKLWISGDCTLSRFLASIFFEARIKSWPFSFFCLSWLKGEHQKAGVVGPLTLTNLSFIVLIKLGFLLVEYPSVFLELSL